MAWTDSDKQKWFNDQTIKRSYLKDVVSKIQALSPRFAVKQYGALTLNPDLYPLFHLTSKKMDATKRTVLITGGVHGYETSGVHGALGFLERAAATYEEHFNVVCFPCISPWAYETVNRWNTEAIDPNRSFKPNSPAEECKLMLAAVETLGVKPFAHFDLHETTDTDNTVFRPQLEQRDGITRAHSEIPDGFYAVGNSEKPAPAFQKAIIDSVRQVTHIAAADENGHLIGDPIAQEGVINYPVKRIFLCAGLSDADYATTTEVYPDSPKVTDAICVDAQIAAILGGLDYLLEV